MTVYDLLEKLKELDNNGDGNLLVSDKDFNEIMYCEKELSSDGVGQFVMIKSEQTR